MRRTRIRTSATPYDHAAAPRQSNWTGTGPSSRQRVKFCIRLFALTAWNAPALAKSDPAGDLFEAFNFAAPPRLGVPSASPK
jgi:hypothetical protein